MAKLSSILIGALVMCLVGVGFLIFSTTGLVVYTPPDYSNSTMSSFQESFSKLNATITEADTKLGESETKTGILDVVGDFLGQAISVFKITRASVNVYGDMVDTGITATSPLLGQYGSFIKSILMAIIFVVFIAIGMNIITKSDQV
jgi:hypothetical protein